MLFLISLFLEQKKYILTISVFSYDTVFALKITLVNADCFVTDLVACFYLTEISNSKRKNNLN